MPNTYTQIHLQLVFAVKYRQALIHHSWKENLHKYITGIVQSNKHKMLQINSMPDHIHLLIGMRPDQAISALVQNVKAESSRWIKQNEFCKMPFYWQEGFGAFSYSPDDVFKVANYIKNQEIHHQKKGFLDEYQELLKDANVEYNQAFLFTEPC